MAKTETGPTIQQTIEQLLDEDLSPDKLLKKVRKAHPDASKSDIIRAACASMLDQTDSNPERAKLLHNAALEARKQ